ncbi:MAG: hypothetical protein KKF85_03810 [Gammaproteobacteria bacterium]|nr:hypothetical protein [Rhodocyclaceae bacterium]MBU3908354.1 hypothetical protein [Gammaproteobacteria bacterium]MBU3987863.1 hypothetical protein [Gammaproteobacteria bacterium]MBU4004064.1 hypothetical protein [Gammaproteobacteria bacterium]MBU4020311.1 hypothetical protein [Gammaproteobacteria bacterium]
MQPIEQKILSRIYGRGRGWAFTKTDFVAEFGEANIHQALSGLARAGTIRRVCHGVYDYPRHSELLGQLSPDIDQVAQALARKFNWRIQPSGDTALNLLGLSTQVPGKWLYLSDGPSRQYTIGQQVLAFRQSALKDTGLKLRESGLLVQALKALGKAHVDTAVVATLRQWLDPQLHARVLRDTRMVTGWIYEIVKQVCQESEGRA